MQAFCASVPGQCCVRVVKYLSPLSLKVPRAEFEQEHQQSQLNRRKPLFPHQEFPFFDFWQVFASFNFHQDKPSVRKIALSIFPQVPSVASKPIFFVSVNIYIPLKKHLSKQAVPGQILMNRLQVKFGTQLASYFLVYHTAKTQKGKSNLNERVIKWNYWCETDTETGMAK